MSDRDESIALTDEEKEALRWNEALTRVASSALRGLGHQDSRRGKQRALALLIGRADENGHVSVHSLRRLLHELNLRNDANFVQDMTKDSNDSTRGRGDDGLWSIHTYRYSRELSGYWRLTEKGKALAEEYGKLIDKATDRAVEHRIDVRGRLKESVARTFTIRPKVAACAFCREPITDEDKAVCQHHGDKAGCGSVVHATCLVEFGSRGSRWDAYTKGEGAPCVLRNTTAGCRGHYHIVAQPIDADAPAAKPSDSGEE